MKLLELLALADENSALRITLDGEYVVAHYDGHDSIDEEYNDCEVNSMFPTTISAYDALGREYQKPYISIDIASKEYVEIWHTEDGDDWAQVTVDKATGIVTDIQTGDHGDWSGEMAYEDAVAWLKEDGYTDFDPMYDRYNSWIEYDDNVTVGGSYEYV